MVDTTMPSVLTIFLLSGFVMKTVKADSGTNLTELVSSNITEIIQGLINQVIMDGFAGERGNLAYNISNIMVADLMLDQPTIDFADNTLSLGLQLPMFDVSADWELQFNWPRRTFIRRGEMMFEAETFAINAAIAFPGFELTSCNTDVEFSLSVTGSAIVQTILESSLIDGIEAGVARAVCGALGTLASLAN